jgi:hypothetical protein
LGINSDDTSGVSKNRHTSDDEEEDEDDDTAASGSLEYSRSWRPRGRARVSAQRPTARDARRKGLEVVVAAAADPDAVINIVPT